ncbi:hypothetical protein EBX93_16545, partial [bacterium]|nr:hypothetical protein [bacterium]
MADDGNYEVYKIARGGSAANSYSISPSLPAGLSLNTHTGVISGTPTAASVATNYTITAHNLCTTNTQINIIVHAACTPTASYDTIHICSSALPYSWNGLTFTATGSQTAHLTNAGGCDSSATLNLVVKSNYTITASAGANGTISNSGVSSVCEGNNSVTYTITPNSGYNIASVLVDGVNQGAISSYNFTNVTSNHTIDVSFVLNCASTTSTSNATVCANTLPYLWNSNSYTIAGTYTVHLINAGGCDSAATLNLTVTPNASAGDVVTSFGVTRSISICSLSIPETVYPETLGGSWSSRNSSIATGVKATGTTSSAYITGLMAGTTTILYTLPSLVNGCNPITEITVVVAPQSTPELISGPSSMCVSSPTTFTTTSTGGVWGTAGYATINSSGVATATSPGTTAIKYTITNASGCSATVSKPITVYALPAAPTIAYASGTTGVTTTGGICKNKTFNVT